MSAKHNIYAKNYIYKNNTIVIKSYQPSKEEEPKVIFARRYIPSKTHTPRLTPRDLHLNFLLIPLNA
jgi:hypothetical protein